MVGRLVFVLWRLRLGLGFRVLLFVLLGLLLLELLLLLVMLLFHLLQLLLLFFLGLLGFLLVRILLLDLLLFLELLLLQLLVLLILLLLQLLDLLLMFLLQLRIHGFGRMHGWRTVVMLSGVGIRVGIRVGVTLAGWLLFAGALTLGLPFELLFMFAG